MNRRRRKQRAIYLWHSQMTAAEAAAACGFASSPDLRRFWSECQEDGRLPAGHRPYFPPLPSRDEALLIVDGDLADDDVSDDLFVPGVPAGDPLLKALERVHGADPLRARDDVVEVDCQDGGKIITLPSRARLKEACTLRDLFVAALIGIERGYGAISKRDYLSGEAAARSYAAVLAKWHQRGRMRAARCAS